MGLGKIVIRNGAYVTKENLPSGETVDCVWIKATDSEQLKVLREAQSRACLGSLEIVLLIPTNPENVNPFLDGFAAKQDGVYYICINPPSRFDDMFYNDRRDLAKTMRHEMAHIKNCDCDRNLPPVIKWLYNLILEEPRAKYYAKKSR